MRLADQHIGLKPRRFRRVALFPLAKEGGLVLARLLHLATRRRYLIPRLRPALSQRRRRVEAWVCMPRQSIILLWLLICHSCLRDLRYYSGCVLLLYDCR